MVEGLSLNLVIRGFKVLVLVGYLGQEHLTIEWFMRGFSEWACNL
jgi:hypothetical protein